jgi:hypothetical protein
MDAHQARHMGRQQKSAALLLGHLEASTCGVCHDAHPIGGMDANFFLHFDDLDLCLRVRGGR